VVYSDGHIVETETDEPGFERLSRDKAVTEIGEIWDTGDRYPGWEDDAYFDENEEEIMWRFRNEMD